MLTIQQTDAFQSWLHNLKDMQARVQIFARIDRLRLGHFGDCKVVGENVSELRMHSGPGYRIYFMKHQHTVVVLLAGGTKSSQKRDIKQAQKMAKQIIEGSV